MSVLVALILMTEVSIGEAGILLHLEKLKQDPGESTAVASRGAAPCQQVKSVNYQQRVWAFITMAAALLQPSKSYTRTSLVASSHWQHNGKGILRNVIQSIQVDTLKSHYSPPFFTMALRHTFLNYCQSSNKSINEVTPNIIHLLAYNKNLLTVSPENNKKIPVFVCGCCLCISSAGLGKFIG